MDSKSAFRGLPEVQIQQKIAFWKAESLSFSVLKELAPEDASIARYGDFESNHFVVGRLRRRAFGGMLVICAEGATPKASDDEVVRVKSLILSCRFEIAI